MNEQEFNEGLKKYGLDESLIKELVDVYHKIKEKDPELTLESWFDRAVKTYEKNKNETTDFLTF